MSVNDYEKQKWITSMIITTFNILDKTAIIKLTAPMPGKNRWNTLTTMFYHYTEKEQEEEEQQAQKENEQITQNTKEPILYSTLQSGQSNKTKLNC